MLCACGCRPLRGDLTSKSGALRNCTFTQTSALTSLPSQRTHPPPYQSEAGCQVLPRRGWLNCFCHSDAFPSFFSLSFLIPGTRETNGAVICMSNDTRYHRASRRRNAQMIINIANEALIYSAVCSHRPKQTLLSNTCLYQKLHPVERFVILNVGKKPTADTCSVLCASVWIKE